MTEPKNHFRQRVPGFVDIDNFIEFDFDTTEELANHSFIQKQQVFMLQHRNISMICINLM